MRAKNAKRLEIRMKAFTLQYLHQTFVNNAEKIYTQFVKILYNCHIELTDIQTLTYARTDKVISKDCFNSKNYTS